MQKVGGGTSPTAAFEHKLLDAECQWVRLDNTFDDSCTVRRNSLHPARAEATRAFLGGLLVTLDVKRHQLLLFDK